MHNAKLLVPPVIFLLALLAMVTLHLTVPLATLVQPPGTFLGAVVLTIGVVVVVAAARLFKRAKTPINPLQQPTALVTEGLYRFTRNPMYLGMAVVLTGVGLLLGSATPFVVIPGFMLLIQTRFIHSEEARLEQSFGSSYAEYKRRVRRWL